MPPRVKTWPRVCCFAWWQLSNTAVSSTRYGPSFRCRHGWQRAQSVISGPIGPSHLSGEEGWKTMPRKKRYTGVLKPLQMGKGSPEVSLLLIYDIENDRLRTRASDICLNYGLERIQFSAFFGKLNRNRRQELALQLQREMGAENARIRIIPVCEQDLKDM